MIPKQKFREIVFELLYSYDMSQASAEEMAPLLMSELSVSLSAVKDAQQQLQIILDKLPDIDSLITQSTRSYSFERIQSVERNILRLGVYELLFDEEIPPKVAIAEAIRLTRKFGTPESALFVNAILDHLYQLSKGEQGNLDSVSNTIEEMQMAEEERLKKSKILFKRIKKSTES